MIRDHLVLGGTGKGKGTGTGTGRLLEAVGQVEIVSPQVGSVPNDGHTKNTQSLARRSRLTYVRTIHTHVVYKCALHAIF